MSANVHLLPNTDEPMVVLDGLPEPVYAAMWNGVSDAMRIELLRVNLIEALRRIDKLEEDIARLQLGGDND